MPENSMEMVKKMGRNSEESGREKPKAKEQSAETNAMRNRTGKTDAEEIREGPAAGISEST